MASESKGISHYLRKDGGYNGYRIRVFFITWLAYVGFYLTRKSFGVAKVGILADENVTVTKADMGWIDFVYLICYAAGQFMWGPLSDRFGSKKIVLGGFFFSIIMGVFMGLSSYTWMFIGLYAVQGLCQSTGWAPLTRSIGQWFSRNERGTVMGFWCTNYALGGVIASAIAGFAGEHYGWRYSLYVPAGVLGIVFLLFMWLHKEKPEDVGLPSIEDYHGVVEDVLSEDDVDELDGLNAFGIFKHVVSNRMVQIMGLVYFLLKPTRYAIVFWGPVYVSEKLQEAGMLKAGLVSAAFELGGPISIILGGYLSDKLFDSKRMPMCVICLFLLSGVLFSFDYFTNSGSISVMIGMLFAIGFFLYVPDSLISGTAAIDFGSKKGAATAAGFINGAGSIGAILGGSLPGYVSEKYGWDVLFYCLGGAIFLAGLILIPQWNTVPESKHKKR